MTQLRKKLKSRSGFSLAEMLMATAIMLLASAVMVAGIPAARSAFENILLGANAQAMLSTTVATLRDELGGAWDVNLVNGDNTAITYFSADTGTVSGIHIDKTKKGDGKTILLSRSNSVDDVFLNENNVYVEAPHPLLVEGAADTGSLYVTYGTVSLSKSDKDSAVNDLVTFNNLQVFRTKSDSANPLAKLDSLVIRLYTANIKTISTPSQS